MRRGETKAGLLPFAALVVAVLGVSWPDVARACSSCFLESDVTREAYYATTILMVVVPLLLAATLGLWLHRAARRRTLESGTPTRSD